MAEDAIKAIGQRLRGFRELNGLTREQFCEKLEIDSYHWGTIERGERNISLQRLLQVCDVFGVDVQQFLPPPTAEQDTTAEVAQVAALLHGLNKKQLLVVQKFIAEIVPHI